MLQTRARLRYFPSSFSFWWVFDRPHYYDMYEFSFWSTFKSVFDENAQRFGVDGRPKRLEMRSNENALVWTGPETVPICLTGISKWVRKRITRFTDFAVAMSSLKEFASARKLEPCPSNTSPTLSQLSISSVETPVKQEIVHVDMKPDVGHTPLGQTIHSQEPA